MIIEFEVNGARVIVSGDNLTVNVTQEREQSQFVAQPKKSQVSFPSADQIKALRKSLGMSQARFAEVLETTQQNVCRWENGDVTPRIENALMIMQMIEGSSS